jgi:hypothetical protein
MSGIISQNVGRPSGLVKAVAAAGGTWTLIKTLTASADSNLSFVDGSDDVTLDSTYPIYVFKFINIHPETDGQKISFNLSTDGGSNYNVTKTTTFISAYHNEGDSAERLLFESGQSIAQGTGYQNLVNDCGADNDQCCSGYLYLFSPSSTTYVKHFIHRMNSVHKGDYSQDNCVAGYANTTSATDAVDFKFTSGNIDAGKIKLFGIGDS